MSQFVPEPIVVPPLPPKYQVVAISGAAAIEIFECDSIEQMARSVANLQGQDCHVRLFQGQQLQVTKGPFRQIVGADGSYTPCVVAVSPPPPVDPDGDMADDTFELDKAYEEATKRMAAEEAARVIEELPALTPIQPQPVQVSVNISHEDDDSDDDDVIDVESRDGGG